jgi:hypothetical protein
MCRADLLEPAAGPASAHEQSKTTGERQRWSRERVRMPSGLQARRSAFAALDPEDARPAKRQRHRGDRLRVGHDGGHRRPARPWGARTERADLDGPLDYAVLQVGVLDPGEGPVALEHACPDSSPTVELVTEADDRGTAACAQIGEDQVRELVTAAAYRERKV